MMAVRKITTILLVLCAVDILYRTTTTNERKPGPIVPKQGEHTFNLTTEEKIADEEWMYGAMDSWPVGFPLTGAWVVCDVYSSDADILFLGPLDDVVLSVARLITRRRLTEDCIKGDETFRACVGKDACVEVVTTGGMMPTCKRLQMVLAALSVARLGMLQFDADEEASCVSATGTFMRGLFEGKITVKITV